ncbi:hypothetical protein HNQ50_003103 [Silvimonas terrae]|uniref:Transmembrane protein n=1 Tax=Silvimonas terrae TaxID=300266 RepID=A0A840RJD6_9NEIS|nr:hypothetical protein [Silvimonas terrae]MBB5192362.1 hypothetical protein [Silvimonas terrae]
MKTSLPPTYARFDAFVHPLKQLPFWLWLAVLFCGWLISHPYLGIRHDGFLYAGQALRSIYPDHYAGDLFFLYGSQDSFTWFSWLYGKVILWLGLPNAARSMMFLGQLAWFGSLTFLLRSIFKQWSSVYLGLVLGIALLTYYGAATLFTSAEGFLTARSYSEPLVILGIALLVRQKTVSSLIVLAFAATIHPLIALPGLAIWYVSLALILQDSRQKWVYAAFTLILVASVVLLVVFKVPPFGNLTKSYDGAWYAVTSTWTADLFVWFWKWKDWAPVLVNLAIILLYFRLAEDGPLRRLVLASTAVFISAMLLTYIGADVLKNVFIVSCQLWRAQWVWNLIVHLLVLPWFWSNRHRLDPVYFWALACAVISLFAQYYPWSSILIGSSVLLTVFHREIHLDPRIRIAISSALIVGVIAAFLNENWLQLPLVGGMSPYSYYQLLFPRAVSLFIIAVALTFFCLSPKSVIRGLILTVLIVLTLLTWDRRPLWTIYTENIGDRNPFSHYIGKDEAVLWGSFNPYPWIILNRPSYLNIMSAAGVPFTKAFALEYVQRRQLVYHAADIKACQAHGYSEDDCATNLIASSLKECDIDDRLAYLVTYYPLDGKALATWTPRVPFGPETIYLYRCKDYLQGKKKK